MPSDFDKYLENLTDDEKSQFDQASEKLEGMSVEPEASDSSFEKESTVKEQAEDAGKGVDISSPEDSSGPEVAQTFRASEAQPQASTPNFFSKDQVDNTPSTDQTVQKDSLAAYPEADPNQKQDDLQQEQQRQNDDMEM